MSRLLRSSAMVAFALSGVIACASRQTDVQPSSATTTSGDAVPAAPAMATNGVLPAGGSIMVRLVDPISTESAREGTPFQANLASPIRNTGGGNELIPAGTTVTGRVLVSEGGGAIRRPKLEIALTSIEASDRSIPIATNSAGAEGARGGALKKVGAGTLIGAAAGSAGAGAAVGGAVVLLSGGKQIAIQPGTLVEFRLTQPAQL